MVKQYTHGKAVKNEAYNCQFDSLLEQTYAHFFELCGFKWERPQNGFLVPNKPALCWLPDFRIEFEDSVFYIEVKPNFEFVNFAKFARALFQDKNVACCFPYASTLTITRRGCKAFYQYLPENFETLWEEALLLTN